MKNFTRSHIRTNENQYPITKDDDTSKLCNIHTQTQQSNTKPTKRNNRKILHHVAGNTSLQSKKTIGQWVLEENGNVNLI